MKIVVLWACFAILPSIVVAQSGEGQLREAMNDSLGKLARATNIEELEREWSTVAPKDFPHRAVYAAMYSKLNGANSDSVLVDALPTDGKQMLALYYAQDTREGQDMAVTDAYNTFYSALSQAVIRKPENIPQFLRLIHAFHFEDNVDEWPWLCGLASKIYQATPEKYARAVRELQPKYRQEALDCRKPPDAP